MDQHDQLGRLRAEEIHEELAILREERIMAAAEVEMKAELRTFEAAEEDAKQAIEAEWRREHWGHEPERPAAWRRAARGAPERLL